MSFHMAQEDDTPEDLPANPKEAAAGIAGEGRWQGKWHIDPVLLKKYLLWLLRFPATVCLEVWRYLSIAVLKARIQMIKWMNLRWAYAALGRAAYEKQMQPDTFSVQYAEIKEVEGKLAEKCQPATSGKGPRFKTKAGQICKNLVSWLQSLPLTRRANRLQVTLGRTISTDEAVGLTFFTEWSNLTLVRTKIANLEASCKATIEYIPSQTDFPWWPGTVAGILIVLALLSISLLKTENRFYRFALAFFFISGTRYLWFSLNVPGERRAKLKWWKTPGAISGLACLILIPFTTRTHPLPPELQTNVAETKRKKAPVKVDTTETISNPELNRLAHNVKSGFTSLFEAGPPMELPNTSTAKTVDERLFLMRLLAFLSERLFEIKANSQQFQESLTSLRHTVNRHYLDVNERHVDETIVSLYGELLSAIDSYASFLADIGKIKRDAAARIGKETTESGFSAGYAGGAVAASSYNENESGSDAAIAGLATAAIAYLWDDYNKGKARAEAEQQAVAEAQKVLERKFSTFIARCQNASLTLTEKYSWNSGEAGFETTSIPSDSGPHKRPRDPFAVSLSAYLSGMAKGLSYQEVLDKAKQSERTLGLIPRNPIYDDYKSIVLWRAADLATQASLIELGSRSWTNAHSEAGIYAVSMWDAYLKYSSDSTGEAREKRAWALARSGESKKALGQALAIQALRSKNALYAYNLACLLSIDGQTENSFKWFEYAVRGLGFNDIKSARGDPDLEAMRISQKEQFETLAEVSWAWNLEFGTFNDDITLRNNSAFALTNVQLTYSIEGGGQTFNGSVSVPRLGVGQTKTWRNEVSVKGSRTKSRNATVTCDQK